MTEPKITDETSYQTALRTLERLWDAPPGSDDEAAADRLAAEIARYEEAASPVGPVTPRDVVEFHLHARGQGARKELADLLGSPSRVSDVLCGKRGLSDAMKRALHRAWHIPYELLIEGAIDDPPLLAAAEGSKFEELGREVRLLRERQERMAERIETLVALVAKSERRATP